METDAEQGDDYCVAEGRGQGPGPLIKEDGTGSMFTGLVRAECKPIRCAVWREAMRGRILEFFGFFFDSVTTLQAHGKRA